MENGVNGDESLDVLLRAYREACEAPEISANFMPGLWQRIDARQRYSFFFGRVAGGFVTAAVALCLAMGVYLAFPGHSSVFYSQNYVEALAAAHAHDNTDLYEILHTEGGVVTASDEI